MATLLEIVDLARSLLNEELSAGRTFPDDTSSFWRDTTLREYANRAQHEVAGMINQVHEFFFVTSTSITLSASVDEYALPLDVLKIVRVEDIVTENNPIELLPITFNDKDAYALNYNTGLLAVRENVGQPRQYAIKGDRIVFRPRPASNQASAIRVHYIKRLSDLSAASDVSEVPDEWYELLGWGVVKKAQYQQEGDTTVAIAEFNRLSKGMMNSLENRQVQRPRFVKRKRMGA